MYGAPVTIDEAHRLARGKGCRGWPEVEGEYRRLRARPTLIAAALAALGIGSGLLIRRRRR